MNNTQIQEYCRKFFAATNSPILRDEPNFLQVELPREIDKELTDRPYYWMWVETIGEPVPNTVLNLVFDPDVEIEDVQRTELIALGCFRLEKIFESARRRGQFVRLTQTDTPSLLRVPFLLTTLKISWMADRRRDEIRSYGINLKSGKIYPELYEQVRDLPFVNSYPESESDSVNRSLLAASLQTGWQQIKDTVLEQLQNDDHSWAEQAKERLQSEIDQLETYYQSLLLENEQKQVNLAAEKELRIAELKWRSQPRIEVQPIHFALLYLDATQLTDSSSGT
ncbi:YqhG family protein [Effusibacillus dendaii]|uniref:YqhG n=1 Tax=Effusibacillus dendaii TaxID=2743772 RepID=A0A7I8D786_9BACL|nr:YqhG family protein [Effusibacillus dendaii]BCJ85944.1 hypothetical protein skT53_09290 [Effusibacillus dendaii]